MNSSCLSKAENVATRKRQMANKRIELEHYKYFIKLGDEEPDRKRVRAGAYIGIITMMVFLVFLLVLGILSDNLAKNPANVLEEPASAQPEIPTEQLEMPIEQQELPSGGVRSDKTLVAQAESGEVNIPGTNVQDQLDTQDTIPVDTTGTLPAVEATTEERKGPGEQSKGAGNLANLANGLGGRGLELYFLVISIGLIILLYLPLKRIRQQRKSH